MKLILKATGTELKPGDKVTTFRGEVFWLRSWREPHNINSTGRVVLGCKGTNAEVEYYPSVIGAEFV